MNRPLFKSHKKVFSSVVAFVGLVVLVALCGAYVPAAVAQDAAPAAGQRTDGQIEMDVVHALDGSKALKNDLITAATIQGEVTLSGTVSSAASSELAESIASHVQGVTKVDNSLKVGNPQDAQVNVTARCSVTSTTGNGMSNNCRVSTPIDDASCKLTPQPLQCEARCSTT